MTYDGGAGLLLSDRFTKVLTSDLSAARPAIEILQGPLRVTPKVTRCTRTEPVQVRPTACGCVAISTFKFGTTLNVVPDGLSDAILVTTPVQGRAGVAIRGNVRGVDPRGHIHFTGKGQPDVPVRS